MGTTKFEYQGQGKRGIIDTPSVALQKASTYLRDVALAVGCSKLDSFECTLDDFKVPEEYAITFYHKVAVYSKKTTSYESLKVRINFSPSEDYYTIVPNFVDYDDTCLDTTPFLKAGKLFSLMEVLAIFEKNKFIQVSDDVLKTWDEWEKLGGFML